VERSQPASLVALDWHSMTAIVADGVNPEPLTEMTCPSATFVDGWACRVGLLAPASMGTTTPTTRTDSALNAVTLSEVLHKCMAYLRLFAPVLGTYHPPALVVTPVASGPSSPWFGLPVSPQLGMVDVHPSSVLTFSEPEGLTSNSPSLPSLPY
jgi:hypothetical protein